MICKVKNKCSICPREKRVRQKKVLGRGLLVDPVTKQRQEEDIWNFYSQMMKLEVCNGGAVDVHDSFPN